MILFLYLAAIVVANVITAAFVPLQAGPFLIPYGSWLIGATLVLRDIIQRKYGRKKAYIAIVSALLLSALSSVFLGDTLVITAASAISFLLSESADTEIYTRLKVPFLGKVLTSGVISGTLDSVLFVVIGLSPLFSGILSWDMIPNAILGQLIVKCLMQVIGVLVLYVIKNRWEVNSNAG
ncbi:VUT family protein [Dehalobacter sp. DCM]|uniref:VUT family protein n=1 Tax=Dehalobacter sp. DCM TaxID=2907827 RepID=UPI003081974B|nr:VUT family protein [Dehalobacter sp. DCM]